MRPLAALLMVVTLAVGAFAHGPAPIQIIQQQQQQQQQLLVPQQPMVPQPPPPQEGPQPFPPEAQQQVPVMPRAVYQAPTYQAPAYQQPIAYRSMSTYQQPIVYRSMVYTYQEPPTVVYQPAVVESVKVIRAPARVHYSAAAEAECIVEESRPSVVQQVNVDTGAGKRRGILGLFGRRK